MDKRQDAGFLIKQISEKTDKKNNQDVQEVRRDLFTTQTVGVFGQVGREIDAKRRRNVSGSFAPDSRRASFRA